MRKYNEIAIQNMLDNTILLGAHWRMLRLETLVDLMIMNLTVFLKQKEESSLISFIENIIIFKYNLKYGIISDEIIWNRPFSEQDRFEIKSNIDNIVEGINIRSIEQIQFEELLKNLKHEKLSNNWNRINEILGKII